MISLKIIERFGGADKTYCADGYKIILVACVGVVLFDDISDKAQIMDYQFIPCGIVPLGDFTDTFRLVLGGELSRELISSLKVQSIASPPKMIPQNIIPAASRGLLQIKKPSKAGFTLESLL